MINWIPSRKILTLTASLLLSAQGYAAEPGSAEARDNTDNPNTAVPDKTGATGSSGLSDASARQNGLEGAAQSAIPQMLNLQATLIGQQQLPMHSPYEGPNSLPGKGDGALSQSYTMSIGSQLSPRWQAYADLRLQRGNGINNGSGLGGYSNADFIPGTASAPPYWTHAYFRYVKPLSSKTTEVEKDQDKLPGKEAADRFVVKFGRILPTDDFDKNAYADSPTTQFMNLGLVNNPAWDNAQNARGVTNGVFVGVYHPTWSLRYGGYQMPTTANGPDLDNNVFRSRSDNVEMSWLPQAEKGPAYHFTVYRNQANMGGYAEAVNTARATGQTPDIKGTERPRRAKTGISFTMSQPLMDDGNTGLLAGFAWNDGKTEDFSFTEADSDAFIGVQISGVHWQRKDDRVGVALLINGLSAPHRDYLALGGTGFQLGDGRLNYGTEKIIEGYYNYSATKHVSFGPDLQLIRNPGYNRDRGPAVIIGARFHVEF